MALRLLLVDDSEVYRETMELVLAREDDLDVVGATADGEEALRLARELQPDVVVLDYRLPGAHGAEVTAALVDSRADVAVLCLTAEATPHERAGVLAAGARAVVEKGDLEALLDAIRAT